MELYQGYDWIKVPRHKDDPSKTWEERYRALEQHHIAETTFLINKVRELAERLTALERPVHSHAADAGK